MRKLWVILIFVLLLIFAYSKLDWWVTQRISYEGSNWMAYAIRYWAWQSVVWVLIGLAVATAYWAGAPSGCRTKYIVFGILVTFVIILVSNLLDWMYFWFNNYVLPPIDQKWTWMPQSWALGFDWGTPEQIQWTVAWLLTIPLLWLAVKYLIPKFCRT